MKYDEFQKIMSLIQSPDDEVVVLGIELLSPFIKVLYYEITDNGVFMVFEKINIT